MFKTWPLGKTTEYVQTYAPHLLYPVPRSLGREMLNLTDELPFHGIDMWTGFELSWLNPKGKPQIAMAEFTFPYNSPFIVESKSLKLYLCSLHQTFFESFDAVQKTLERDLVHVCQAPVQIHLIPPSDFHKMTFSDFSGTSLDDLDIETSTYRLDPSLLTTHSSCADEKLYSHLLKSNCLATGQPDWGSVYIHYKGHKIDPAGLLKYIISYRDHSGFAEHCVERMYVDIMQQCAPEALTVYARYTKRGGLDINPFRSNFEKPPANKRQVRQ